MSRDIEWLKGYISGIDDVLDRKETTIGLGLKKMDIHNFMISEAKAMKSNANELMEKIKMIETYEEEVTKMINKEEIK